MKKTFYVVGHVVRHRQFTSKFVCWDSFKREWFWGPRRLSELFPVNSSKLPMLCTTLFPEGRVFDAGSWKPDGGNNSVVPSLRFRSDGG